VSGLSRSALLLAVAGATLGLSSMPAMALRPGVSVQQRAPRSIGRGSVACWWNYQNGPGWTAAQVKRMAKKRRNQQRHKRRV